MSALSSFNGSHVVQKVEMSSKVTVMINIQPMEGIHVTFKFTH
jgi:hypothetical protein